MGRRARSLICRSSPAAIMTRECPIACAAALLVTYGLVDSIADYAYPVPADAVVATARAATPH